MELTNPKVIKYILSENGFKFSKALGQNFLIDPDIPHNMATLCGADQDTDILEIGPGIGCLTSELLKISNSVTSIELDSRLIPILKHIFEGCEHFHLIEGDCLKLDLSSILQNFSASRRGICANLPYYITTPVITKLFDYRSSLDFICVMVQREVAKRFCAKPASKDYGAITLFCNYYAECEYLFDVPKESFMPSPNVDSAVILFKMLKFPPVSPKNPDNMFKIIKAAFAQRRKTFKNALQNAFPSLPPEKIISALYYLGKQEKMRGEELSLAEFAILSDYLLG